MKTHCPRGWNLPDNFGHIICTNGIDIDSSKPRSELDESRIGLPKINSYLGIVINEGGSDISVFRI